jgi:hypothetical protein
MARARLALGRIFLIGYTSAFVIPLIGGAIWDATHLLIMAFVPVILSTDHDRNG